MIAAELYEKTWIEYMSLPRTSRQSLSKYCKEHRVNYRGFKYWMQSNSYSGSLSKQSSRQRETSFIPLSVMPSANNVVPTVSIVKSVKISLRNGLKITLGEISGKDMIEIITLIHQF
jgi:hypothetical protein